MWQQQHRLILKKTTSKRTAPKTTEITSKGNSKLASLVDPDLRNQMIAEATYFRYAFNRLQL